MTVEPIWMEELTKYALGSVVEYVVPPIAPSKERVWLVLQVEVGTSQRSAVEALRSLYKRSAKAQVVGPSKGQKKAIDEALSRGRGKRWLSKKSGFPRDRDVIAGLKAAQKAAKKFEGQFMDRESYSGVKIYDEPRDRNRKLNLLLVNEVNFYRDTKGLSLRVAFEKVSKSSARNLKKKLKPGTIKQKYHAELRRRKS